MFSTLVEDDAAGILENMVNVSAYRCDDSILFEQDNAIIDVEEVINHKPTIENPVPEHNAVNISIDATLEIDVNDSDDDLLSVKFYDASDDSLIKSYSSVNPPASKTASWNDLDYNTSYSWYVTVDDGIISTPVRSENYSFTTELEPDNMPPVIGEESPASGSNNIDVNPYLSVEVSDPDIGDMLSITFYTSSGTVIGTDSCTSDCTAQVYWPGRSYDRSYSWYVTVSDGIEEVRGPVTGYWSFNTEQMPDIDLNIRLNGGLGVTLEIENGGADSASEVSWTLDIKSKGVFGRIDEVDGDVIPLLNSGATSSVKKSLFGFGRVEIIATAACEYAESEEITKNALVIGPFVINLK